MTSFIILTLVVVSIAAVKLPSNFQKCNRKQPDLRECIFKAAANGIAQLDKPFSELNIPDLNPFLVEKVSIEGGSGPVAVDQNFKNCKLYGFYQFKQDKFEFDFDKKTLDVDGVFPEIRILCEYVLKGQVLVLPVNGQGNSVIVMKNMSVRNHMEYEEVKKKDKTYLKFISSAPEMEAELVTFDFQNSKDRSITDRLNPVLNDNWKEIFNEVKGSYVQVINQILLNLFNNFWGKVSLEEALDD